MTDPNVKFEYDDYEGFYTCRGCDKIITYEQSGKICCPYCGQRRGGTGNFYNWYDVKIGRRVYKLTKRKVFHFFYVIDREEYEIQWKEEKKKLTFKEI